MEQIINEFAGYGPIGLVVALILFMMRGEIIATLRGGTTETSRLIESINKNTAEMTRMVDAIGGQTKQFENNNQYFQQAVGGIGEVARHTNETHREITELRIALAGRGK